MKLRFTVGACLLSTVMVVHASDDNIDYVWDFGDGSSANEKSPEHVYAEVGIYQAKLMVFQNDKLVDTRVNSVDLITPLINQVTIDYELSDLSLAASAILDAKQALSLTHHWLIEDQTYVGPNANHVFLSQGEYSVKLSSYFDEYLVHETQLNIFASEPEPEPEPEKSGEGDSGGALGVGVFLLGIMRLLGKKT
ncbi:PKD domain-containing protein [Shewanella surugensis]|uniref:PKD domain-containing protein n=1 Tax=Shewanella surugensis TaxID=212020 RepID=A0ABT0LB67_9GAMM|nr:PKD domain-containing protein [Shewanella surugensis]MCL1124943.1 PKD domain-containing protein [Shewanella surugensis]